MNEKERFLRSRAECYKLLSACFYQPEKELLTEEKVLENLTGFMKEACPEAAVFSSEMEAAFRGYGNEELLVEYAKLFIGPFELLAPPYGSVYLDADRRVMGNSTMEVIKLYEGEGLVFSDDFKEIPDHIAVELEFMSFLILKGIGAFNNSDEKVISETAKKEELFFSKLLKPWITPFSDKIKEGTENTFYRSLADCLLMFVEKTGCGTDCQ